MKIFNRAVHLPRGCVTRCSCEVIRQTGFDHCQSGSVIPF
jgi:hypothetical protein